MMQANRISSFILSLLLGSAAAIMPVHAQQNNNNKAPVAKTDSVKWLQGLAVSVDLVGAAQRLLSSNGQYEAALRVNLKDKYFPIVELGIGEADASEITTGNRYTTRAPYGRIGIDFNVMKNKHDDYRIYVGARYAFTSFSYDVEGPVLTDEVWKTQTPFVLKDVHSNYHWAEWVFGIDAKIWGPIRMGWSARYKSRLIYTKSDFGNPWYVPGYGKQGSSRLGGTFNIILEI